MAQHEIEVILLRQLASYLATPIFIVDPTGTLVFYNEAAETILGLRFEDTGAMVPEDLAKRFSPTDDQGNPIPVADIPIGVALTERRPAEGRFWIRSLDQSTRYLQVSAIPLIGQAQRFLGAVAFLHEIETG